MEAERREYKGHSIELRPPASAEFRGEGEELADPELLIDDRPVNYGRLPEGQYYLGDYAYDWTDDLMDLAGRYIDYQDKAEAARRQAPED